MNPYKSSKLTLEVEEPNIFSGVTKIVFIFITGLIFFLAYWQIKRHFDVKKDQKIQQEKLKQTEIELRKLKQKKLITRNWS